MKEYITVVPADRGRRLDLCLAESLPTISRSRLQKLVAAGLVLVNDRSCRDKNYRLEAGDRIEVILPPPGEAALVPEEIALDIAYEDKYLLVVNKPRGMVVHPSPGHSGGTLANALLGHCHDLSGIGGIRRPGIVHRLDKDTSGLLLVAKDDYTHSELAEQLKSRRLQREYIALACGQVSPRRGIVVAPIGRHPADRKKMAVVPGGKEAITGYRVVKYFKRFSLLRLKLETGRTHQIRVHLQYIGYPLAGDPLYGRSWLGELPPALAVPQALHAWRITFVHPRSGRSLRFSAPLPAAFRESLRYLQQHPDH